MLHGKCQFAALPANKHSVHTRAFTRPRTAAFKAASTNLTQPVADNSTSSNAQPFPLEAACCVSKAVIGLNQQGYRGLLAASDIAFGEVVLRIPLHNMLQVPRQLTQPDMQLAASTALSNWQQRHWQLPCSLVSFFLDPDVIWESKLVAWVLYLRTAAPEDSMWRSYCQSLPTAAEAITFCSYSEQQAEQLQFSVWKNLAHKQLQLLQTVKQQCEAAGLQDLLSPHSSSSSSSCSSGVGLQPANPNSSIVSGSHNSQLDYAWALSMVKSRTFGQKLLHAASVAVVAAAAQAAGAVAAAAVAAAVSQELEKDDDDSSVFLLMAPYIDMINHAPDNNCVFGIDADGTSSSVRCSSSSGIACGQEVTISYGSNKSNLALLSCYGFQIPGNPNDAQLVAPVFKSCLAAAGSVDGFAAQLLQQAAELAANQQQQQQQQQQAEVSGPANALLHPDVVEARRGCALASIPAANELQQQQQQQQQASGGFQGGRLVQSQQQILQQQKYMAQLMLYQIRLIFKRCGTSIDQDLQELSAFVAAAAAAAATATTQAAAAAAAAGSGTTGSCSDRSTDGGSSDGSSAELDAAIQQQAVLARLEQKLLLQECERILQQVTELLVADMKAAVSS